MSRSILFEFSKLTRWTMQLHCNAAHATTNIKWPQPHWPDERPDKWLATDWPDSIRFSMWSVSRARVNEWTDSEMVTLVVTWLKWIYFECMSTHDTCLIHSFFTPLQPQNENPFSGSRWFLRWVGLCSMRPLVRDANAISIFCFVSFRGENSWKIIANMCAEEHSQMHENKNVKMCHRIESKWMSTRKSKFHRRSGHWALRKR